MKTLWWINGIRLQFKLEKLDSLKFVINIQTRLDKATIYYIQSLSSEFDGNVEKHVSGGMDILESHSERPDPEIYRKH